MFSLDWKSGGDRANAGSFGGYLYKLKRKQKMVLSQWNRRYFSIEGTNLRWYENDATSTPSGAVDLSQVTDINEFQSGKSSCRLGKCCAPLILVVCYGIITCGLALFASLFLV